MGAIGMGISDAFLGHLGSGSTFYVDATDGDDGNDGRTPANAWQTITKVNGESFNSSDKILLKRGETWTGVLLIVPGDNITIDAYGNGAKPIIDGNDLVNCIYATGRSGITLRNLELTQGFDFGAQFVSCSRINVIDCDIHEHGNDGLIFFDGTYNSRVSGGKFYNGYRRLADGRQVSGIEIADDCYNIVIDGAECYDNTVNGIGITIHSHSGTILPYNIVIKNVSCYGNAAHGLQVFKQDNTADAHRNILIENSEFNTNVDDGIRIHKSAGATNYPRGVIVDGCEMVGNTRYAIWGEGDDIVLQRSLVHEGRMAFFRDFNDLVIYNNTFYLTTWSGYGPLMLQELSITADGATVKNNIFASPDDGTYIAWCDIITNVDYDYNVYFRPVDALNRFRYDSSLYNFTNWKTQVGGDDNSQLDDPSFADAGSDDFTLDDGSIAINTGVDVGLPFLGSAPDCGAFEKE